MRINVANANKVDKLLEVSGANAKNNANANAKQHREDTPSARLCTFFPTLYD